MCTMNVVSICGMELARIEQAHILSLDETPQRKNRSYTDTDVVS